MMEETDLNPLELRCTCSVNDFTSEVLKLHVDLARMVISKLQTGVLPRKMWMPLTRAMTLAARWGSLRIG